MTYFIKRYIQVYVSEYLFYNYRTGVVYSLRYIKRTRIYGGIVINITLITIRTFLIVKEPEVMTLRLLGIILNVC